MIGIVDVAVQAANPNMPLYPLRAFVNSPSSLRIRNVPKKIGTWNITSVQLVASYPDNSIKTANCKLIGCVWVGTIQGSSTSGTSENGYTVYASGIDENGNPVSNYVLGKGLVEILENDGTITPGQDTAYVHLLDTQPTTPKEGDLYPVSDGYALWADGEANLLKGMTETEAGQMDSLQIQIDDEHAAIIQLGGLIPPQASTSNQLADKAFVNSSVQTATANFRGNWATWNDVPDQSEYYPVDYAGSRTPTVNDYLVVQDASGYVGSQTLEGTWRFKYSGEWSVDNIGGWLPEYQVNETPMTAAQLAALNSNITAAKVAQYDNTIANINYALVTVVESAGIYSIQDRAVNSISITSSDFPLMNLDFPQAIANHARDFILRIVASAGTYSSPPSLVFTGVTLMNADGTMPEIKTDTTNSCTTLIYFSEIAANTFLVKGEALETIS